MVGRPKTAITASPMKFLTVPPYPSISCRALPQLPQNRRPGGLSKPQTEQRTVRALFLALDDEVGNAGGPHRRGPPALDAGRNQPHDAVVPERNDGYFLGHEQPVCFMVKCHPPSLVGGSLGLLYQGIEPGTPPAADVID